MLLIYHVDIDVTKW